MHRRFWIAILQGFLLISWPLLASADIPEFQTGIEAEGSAPVKTRTTTSSPMVTLPAGTQLSVAMMDTITTGWSDAGEVFHARLKKPVVDAAGRTVLRAGTMLHGHVVQAKSPGKRFAQHGRLILAFDYLLLPDGQKVPLKSSLDHGDNALQAMGRGAAGTVGGAVGGVIQAVGKTLSVGGILAAVVSDGFTAGLTGAAGLIGGAGMGAATSGDHDVVREGQIVQVALAEPLVIQPTVKTALPDIALPGLDVLVRDVLMERDPFHNENMVSLDLTVNNQTQHTFGSFDMALLDEYGNLYSVSPFGQQSMTLFQLKPQQETSGAFSFQVLRPESQHYFGFLPAVYA